MHRPRPLFTALLALVLLAPAAPAYAGVTSVGTLPPGVQAAEHSGQVPPTLVYSTLLALAKQHRVSSVVIDEASGQATVTLTGGATRTVAVPTTSSGLADALSADGAQVSFVHSGGGGGFPWVLPLMLAGGVGMLVLWMTLLNRRSQQAARRRSEPVTKAVEKPAVTFADVAGCDEAVEELRDMLDFLRDPERFVKLGATMPTGILLHGSPGTGKTLLAKALAGEAGVPFHAMSGSDFVEMYVGLGAKRVRELFAAAKRSEKGSVIFIDEIDAIGRRRGGPSQPGGGQETENTLNALLVELDGFAGRKGVICIAATNRVDVLDPALLRPGRFGMQIEVATPDEAGRRQILELYSRSKPLAEDVDLDALAAYTAGSSGAQLADMMNQAAIVAVRRGGEEISDSDLREGHLRVLAGPERAGSVMLPEERRLVAWHEAGHVLAAEVLETPGQGAAGDHPAPRPRRRAGGVRPDRPRAALAPVRAREDDLHPGRPRRRAAPGRRDLVGRCRTTSSRRTASPAVRCSSWDSPTGSARSSATGTPARTCAWRRPPGRWSTRRSSAWSRMRTSTPCICSRPSAPSWTPWPRRCWTRASWSGSTFSSTSAAPPFSGPRCRARLRAVPGICTRCRRPSSPLCTGARRGGWWRLRTGSSSVHGCSAAGAPSAPTDTGGRLG